MAIVYSDYNGRVLNSKWFFFSSVTASIVVFAIGVFAYLPTPFDTVIAYHKLESVVPTTIIAATPPDIEEVATSTEELAVVREEVVAALEMAEPEVEPTLIPELEKETNVTVPTVPFYSQFEDITAASWKKVGCGIASLAMLIEYYNSDRVEVDSLLQEGIAAGAYLDSAGWVYAGLIGISKKYGLSGETHDYGDISTDEAFDEFVTDLEEGPVMASVHYTFQKSNPIPHLVIINAIEGEKVYYNDPAEKAGGGVISVAQFKSAWKKRYIEFRLM